jgi:hypothetical protein
MTKIEKRLGIGAILFVLVYLAAAGMTLHSRIGRPERIVRIESTGPAPGENQMMMAQLLLPMLIVLTVAVSFLIVRKKRAEKLIALEKDVEELEADAAAGRREHNENPPRLE